MQGYNPFEKRRVGHWNVTDASNNELQFGECCIPNVILREYSQQTEITCILPLKRFIIINNSKLCFHTKCWFTSYMCKFKQYFNHLYTNFFQLVLQVVIVKLKIDKDRKRILERKARSRQVADKGKHTEEYIMETSLKEYREKKLMELQYMLEQMLLRSLL